MTLSDEDLAKVIMAAYHGFSEEGVRQYYWPKLPDGHAQYLRVARAVRAALESAEQDYEAAFFGPPLSEQHFRAKIVSVTEGAEPLIAPEDRAALYPDVAPLQPGETVTIPDDPEPANDDGWSSWLELRAPARGVLIVHGNAYLDAAGVAALIDVCHRWQAAQED